MSNPGTISRSVDPLSMEGMGIDLEGIQQGSKEALEHLGSIDVRKFNCLPQKNRDAVIDAVIRLRDFECEQDNAEAGRVRKLADQFEDSLEGVGIRKTLSPDEATYFMREASPLGTLSCLSTDLVLRVLEYVPRDRDRKYFAQCSKGTLYHKRLVDGTYEKAQDALSSGMATGKDLKMALGVYPYAESVTLGCFTVRNLEVLQAHAQKYEHRLKELRIKAIEESECSADLSRRIDLELEASANQLRGELFERFEIHKLERGFQFPYYLYLDPRDSSERKFYSKKAGIAYTELNLGKDYSENEGQNPYRLYHKECKGLTIGNIYYPNRSGDPSRLSVRDHFVDILLLEEEAEAFRAISYSKGKIKPLFDFLASDAAQDLEVLEISMPQLLLMESFCDKSGFIEWSGGFSYPAHSEENRNLQAKYIPSDGPDALRGKTKLKELTINLGTPDIASVRKLAQVLAGEDGPTLEKLALYGCSFETESIKILTDMLKHPKLSSHLKRMEFCVGGECSSLTAVTYLNEKILELMEDSRAPQLEELVLFYDFIEEGCESQFDDVPSKEALEQKNPLAALQKTLKKACDPQSGALKGLKSLTLRTTASVDEEAHKEAISQIMDLLPKGCSLGFERGYY